MPRANYLIAQNLKDEIERSFPLLNSRYFLRNLFRELDKIEYDRDLFTLPEGYFSDLFVVRRKSRKLKDSVNGSGAEAESGAEAAESGAEAKSKPYNFQTSKGLTPIVEILLDRYGLKGKVAKRISKLIKKAMIYKLSVDVFARLSKITTPMSSNGSKSMAYDLIDPLVFDYENVFEFFVEPFGRTAAMSYKYASRIKMRLGYDYVLKLIYNDIERKWIIYKRCLRNDVGRLITEIQKLCDKFNSFIDLPVDERRSKLNEFRQDLRDKIDAYVKECEANIKRDRDSKTSVQRDYEIAAMLYVIFKTTTNGVYEQDVKSDYTEEKGRALEVDTDQLRACSFLIKDMEISCDDFEPIIRKYKGNPRAFLLVDPPYLPDEGEKVIGYSEEFTPEDMARLAKSMKNAKCQILFTHYLNKFVDVHMKEAGLVPVLAYVTKRDGKEKPTIVYKKNIELKKDQDYKDRVLLLDGDDATDFYAMKKHVNEYYKSLKPTQ